MIDHFASAPPSLLTTLRLFDINVFGRFGRLSDLIVRTQRTDSQSRSK